MIQGYERAAPSVPPPCPWPLRAGVYGLWSCCGEGWEGVPGLCFIGECAMDGGQGLPRQCDSSESTVKKGMSQYQDCVSLVSVQ